MKRKKIINLTELAKGQSGRVIKVNAGAGLIHRLEAIGLRAGTSVTKVSGIPLRGPVIVQAGGTRVGLGHGMARKVLIEVN